MGCERKKAKKSSFRIVKGNNNLKLEEIELKVNQAGEVILTMPADQYRLEKVKK